MVLEEEKNRKQNLKNNNNNKTKTKKQLKCGLHVESHFKHCKNNQESGKELANLTSWCCLFILEICRKGDMCP